MRNSMQQVPRLAARCRLAPQLRLHAAAEEPREQRISKQARCVLQNCGACGGRGVGDICIAKRELARVPCISLHVG